ncbi:transcriptional regulator [Actinocatenispora thailandica]|uniref:Transcriptional regulator n=1 Tax=Actinocatenispora thailandica TaxID=227318 RepID=A0A7R7DQ03_9ACTN|nr:MerR family transcriptional regulator [Actinocatenispora thailandica]BCJ35566.1 transcriptional regulator [Actinocatenispora thailandica]
MEIGDLAARTGVSRRALRYYEQQGLLTPARRPNGYRDYPEAAERTVRQIQVLLAAGLGTAVIAEILPCLADPAVVRVPVCPELLDGLGAERDRITASVRRLVAARDLLDSLIADRDRPFATSLAELDAAGAGA